MKHKNYINTIEVGERIRKIREERGLSQEELALKVGLQQTMLSRIESATARASIENYNKLGKICDALDYDLVDLLFPQKEGGKDD